MSKYASSDYALPVLRVGLALVYLYFGVSQLLSPADWVGYLPSVLGTTSFANTIIIANGVFEVAAAALLLLGLWVRPVATVLAAHLAFISLSLGFTAVGVRDFGLTFATIALALAPPDRFTLDARRKR